MSATASAALSTTLSTRDPVLGRSSISCSPSDPWRGHRWVSPFRVGARGGQNPGWTMAAEVVGHPHAGGAQGGQVDPGRDAQAVQLPHQVLGRKVSSRATRIGTATKSTGGAIDRGHPMLEGAKGIGQGLSIGVVEMHGHLIHQEPPSQQLVEERHDLSGSGDADGVAKRELGCSRAPARGQHDIGRLVRGHGVAFPRVTEAPWRPQPPRTASPSARARLTTGANISSDAATDRLRLRWAKVSVALPKTAISEVPHSRARSRPRSLGTRTGWRPGRGPSSSSSSSASPNWGTQLRGTKLVSSTALRPAPIRRRMKSAFPSTGTLARCIRSEGRHGAPPRRCAPARACPPGESALARSWRPRQDSNLRHRLPEAIRVVRGVFSVTLDNF